MQKAADAEKSKSLILLVCVNQRKAVLEPHLAVFQRIYSKSVACARWGKLEWLIANSSLFMDGCVRMQYKYLHH